MTDELDPKGLIREAYRIEGITEGECRSIFLDWALSMPMDGGQQAQIAALLERYGGQDAHPMTVTLRAGLQDTPLPRRRGGRRGRVGES